MDKHPNPHTSFNQSSSNFSNQTHVHFGHELDPNIASAIASYFILLIVAGVTANAVLIHIILLKKRRHASSVSLFMEQQHATTNTFVANLAVCDMLTAMSTLPFDAYFLLNGHYDLGFVVCGLKETFFLFSLPASVVNLLLLTCERFVKLFFPFMHQKLFTKLNVTLLLLCAWTYILFIALLPVILEKDAVRISHGFCYIHFSGPYTLYQLIGNFSVPVAVILTMNVFLYYNVHKRANAIERQKTTIRKSREESSEENRRPSGKIRARVSTAIPMNFRAAKTIMTLVGVFIVCWLTFIITVTLNIMCNICFPREVTWLVNAVNYSSVALNPLVYGLQNKSIRHMLVKTYFRCGKQTIRSRDSFQRTESSLFPDSFRRRSGSLRSLLRKDTRGSPNGRVSKVSGTKPRNVSIATKVVTHEHTPHEACENEDVMRRRSSTWMISVKQYFIINFAGEKGKGEACGDKTGKDISDSDLSRTEVVFVSDDPTRFSDEKILGTLLTETVI